MQKEAQVARIDRIQTRNPLAKQVLQFNTRLFKIEVFSTYVVENLPEKVSGCSGHSPLGLIDAGLGGRGHVHRDVCTKLL
jgi:hypothetical protein